MNAKKTMFFYFTKKYDYYIINTQNIFKRGNVKPRKTNVKFNILFLLILSSLLFLCGSMFIPQNDTYSQTKWTDVVTVQDVDNFALLGDGTLESPFLIYNASQLATMAKLISITNVNATKVYKLADNINLSSYEWNPIGTTSYPFRGVFDGNGYVISGLNIASDSNIVHAGLFGCTNEATIKNFSIMNFGSSISANSEISQTYAGAFVGYAQNSTFTDLSNLGVPVYSMSKDTAYSGGIVGYSSSCNFNMVSNYANIVSYVKNDLSQKKIYAYSGGIVGRAYGASNSITYARNNGSVKSFADGTKTTTINVLGIPVTIHTQSSYTYIFAGGIIGQSNVIISTSFNSGEIICGGSSSFVLNNITYSNYLPRTSYAGGIAGESTNTISNTFNTGNITANAFETKTETEEELKILPSTRDRIDEHIGEAWNNQIYYYLHGNVLYARSEVPNDVKSKIGKVITKTNNAYSGGIVGYTDNSISNSYNDGQILGGGKEKTKYISRSLGLYIERTSWFGAKGIIEKVIYYIIELKYFDELFYGSINGNLNSTTTSSYGSVSTQNFQKTINIDSYYQTYYFGPLTNNTNITTANDTYSSSNKIVLTPTYDHIYHDTFASGNEIEYIKNVTFTYNISRKDNNAVMNILMNYSNSYRWDKNWAGYLTGDYYTESVPYSYDVDLNQKINYSIKYATNLTTTNLGGSTYWAKIGGINGNRPYIKDFYW